MLWYNAQLFINEKFPLFTISLSCWRLGYGNVLFTISLLSFKYRVNGITLSYKQRRISRAWTGFTETALPCQGYIYNYFVIIQFSLFYIHYRCIVHGVDGRITCWKSSTIWFNTLKNSFRSTFSATDISYSSYRVCALEWRSNFPMYFTFFRG